MYECDYSREPVDYRLLWLRFLKKIWVFILGALIGAIVVGSIHSVKKLILTGGRTYQAETLYYLEYDCELDILTSVGYNYYTWNEIGHCDEIVDGVYEKIAGKTTKEEIRNAIAISCDSDVRYVYARVTTHDKALSLEIADALEDVLVKFALSRNEFSDAYVITHAEETIEATNYRIKTALILGAFIGLAASIIFWLIAAISDTSIYIPSTIEKRYHIPTLTAPSMEEFEVNCETILGGAKEIGLYTVSKETVLADKLSKYGSVVTFTMDEVAEISLKKPDAIIVEVKAGSHNGKKLERAIEELMRVSLPVSAIALVSEDERLIKSYYRK